MTFEEYDEQESFEQAIRDQEEQEEFRFDEDAREFEFLASYADRCGY